ncbi:Wzz/FepE/Etk N-terminal domain-containing protein [Ligilactobacillus salivarius]|uniref:YveK family protein n=1 Tax=Ligilactobacillus salivarius TaxID=1624 RepID=UPI00263B228E|nr:Wzz/FepE/Etk N-terminal domain-containing protein [Ligilactobacillus salivarius]MDN4847529.1 Wzz/FepE/Etk N-terminal domain-containing protein [Ligilactobacillus salivarius]
MSRKDDEAIIDLSKLMIVLKNNIVSIITWMILGLILALGTVFFLIEPRYSSSIDILVNQKANNAQVQYATQQADLQAINTYKDVLTKPIILTPVLKEIRRTDNYQGNLNALEKSIKVSNQTNSQVITVSVTDKNAYLTADIANTIGKVFAKKVKKMMQVDNVTIVSDAKVNSKPVSPNKKLFALAGAVLGLIIGVAIAFIKEFTDKTVKDSNFLTDELGLTNIGSVYHLDINDNDYGVVKVIARNKISDNDDDEEFNTPRRRRV